MTPPTIHIVEDVLNSNLSWKIVNGTNTTVYYNRTHLKVRLIKTSYTLGANNNDTTTFLLPSNINANMDIYFQAMALTSGWRPTNAIIYCCIKSGTNIVEIRSNTALSNNVILADIMQPCGLFTIS